MVIALNRLTVDLLLGSIFTYMNTEPAVDAVIEKPLFYDRTIVRSILFIAEIQGFVIVDPGCLRYICSVVGYATLDRPRVTVTVYAARACKGQRDGRSGAGDERRVA